MITVSATGDTALLSRLHAVCFDDAWDPKAFSEILAMPGTCAWIAHQGDAPVGLLVVRQVLDEAEILTIGTNPQARRQGVAGTLLDHAQDALKDCQVIYLEVADGNAAALDFYEQQGFAVTGRRRGYYRDGSDALVMARGPAISCG